MYFLLLLLLLVMVFFVFVLWFKLEKTSEAAFNMKLAPETWHHTLQKFFSGPHWQASPSLQALCLTILVYTLSTQMHL